MRQLKNATNVLSDSKFKFGKPVDEIDRAIQAFLTGKTGKYGKYVATTNALVYRTVITDGRQSTLQVKQNIVAIRIDRADGPLFIGNSSSAM